MKKVFLLLIIAGIISCEAPDSTLDVKTLKYNQAYLNLSKDKFVEISKIIKKELEYTNLEDYKGIEPRISSIFKDHSLKINKEFKSLLQLYYEIKSIKNKEELIQKAKENSRFMSYYEEDEYLKLDILPEEAAMLNKNGVIRINDDIIQLTSCFKKTIHNANEDLVYLLETTNKDTKEIKVKHFVESENQLRRRWRTEITYPTRSVGKTVNGKRYQVVGTNFIDVSIFRGIFVKEYTYYVRGEFSTFMDYSKVRVSSARRRASYKHTGNDSYFLYKLGGSENIESENKDHFTTERGQIVATRRGKKYGIEDNLIVTTGFRVVYPDGYVYEGSFSNDSVDEEIIFD